MKAPSRVLLVVYSGTLAWLILFKFSVHIVSALHYDHRSVNPVPFSSASGGPAEIAANVVVFIPLGLLLALNFKRLGLRRSLLLVLAVSLTAEIAQYTFAIGASDITDVITNTAGGLVGLTAYGLGTRFIDEDRLDRLIVTVGSALLVLVLLLLAATELHHGIRYHSPHTGEAIIRNNIGPPQQRLSRWLSEVLADDASRHVVVGPGASKAHVLGLVGAYAGAAGRRSP